ncbi:membrane-associated protein, putative [Bodo saltans]|uniref:Membrane-associated protein, putative n=1 Tax=Bodo saltans TaxID=75058 RepID=A0A0S4JJP3_BODSA|nr:membrane-associated protein, putative [Bodo saltans]|eukprot:CUG91670.1 membrane-associated protein, putative [Bodo saltans]
MRLSVHHKLPVIEGSVLLAAVLRTNVFLSVLIVFPILFSLIGLKWGDLGFVDRAWYTSVVIAYAVLEVPRLIMGMNGNKERSVSSLIGFVTLSLTFHIGIMAVYHAMVPRKNSLDYAISTVEIILAGAEVLLAIVEIRKMVRQNTVNFYVSLGMDV